MGRLRRTWIDKEILRVLATKHWISRRDLVSKVYEKLKKKESVEKQKNQNRDSKTPISAGHSTIIRYLDDLRRQKRIFTVNPSEYKMFGIPRNDKRVTYLMRSLTRQDADHYREVIRALGSNIPAEREAALIEIESLNPFPLSPEELEGLVYMATEKSPPLKVTEAILRILHHNVKHNMIFPKNIENFERQLADFLQKLDRSDKRWMKSKSCAIWMLGILDSPSIITNLKDDISQGFSLEELKYCGYVLWPVANIIHRHQTDLFKFQQTVDEQKRIILFDIRIAAKHNLPKYQRNILEYKKKLEVDSDEIALT